MLLIPIGTNALTFITMATKKTKKRKVTKKPPKRNLSLVNMYMNMYRKSTGKYIDGEDPLIDKMMNN